MISIQSSVGLSPLCVKIKGLLARVVKQIQQANQIRTVGVQVNLNVHPFQYYIGQEDGGGRGVLEKIGMEDLELNMT